MTSLLAQENFQGKAGGKKRHKCLHFNNGIPQMRLDLVTFLDSVETTKEANGLRLCKGKYLCGQCWKPSCFHPLRDEICTSVSDLVFDQILLGKNAYLL